MADTSLDENKIGLLIWKVSNYWQSKLRKILKPFNLSLNEFLILESIYELSLLNSGLSQNEISKYIGELSNFKSSISNHQPDISSKRYALEESELLN